MNYPFKSTDDLYCEHEGKNTIKFIVKETGV